MKARTALILIVLCAAVGAGLWWKLKPTQAVDLARGAKVFPELPVNDIVKVVISDPAGSVTLERKAGTWVVPARHGYYADFNKLADLLRQVYELKVGDRSRVRPASYGKMKLLCPDDKGASTNEQGTVLQFFKQGDVRAATLIVGVEKSGGDPTDENLQFRAPEGQFVRVPGRKDAEGRECIMSVADNFNLEKTPTSWIEKQLCNVAAAEVKSMSVTSPDGGAYAITRPAKDAEFELAGLNATQQLSTANATALGNALTYFTVSDVVAPSVAATNAAMDKPWTLVCRTYDGHIYTVKVSDTNAPAAYAKLTVAYEKPAEPASTNEVAKAGESLYKAEDHAKRLNEKAATWLYVINDVKANELRKTRESLIEAKPALMPEEPAKSPTGVASPTGPTE